MPPSQPCTEFSKNIAYVMVDIDNTQLMQNNRVTIREGFTKKMRKHLRFFPLGGSLRESPLCALS